MFFKSIEVENFLSYKRGRFDIANGLVLVSGLNGSGKSSLWVDSICFCLTGQTTKGGRGDEVINWRIGGDCKVCISFVNNGSLYVVNRYRSHSGVDEKGVPFGNRLIYSRDGNVVEKSTIALTQDALLEEINVDVELLKCTMILSQDSKFNFVDSTDKKQKEILSKIRRVDFDDKLKSVKEKLSELNEAVDGISTKMVILRSHQVTKEELIDLKAKADDFARNNKSEIKGIREEIEGLKSLEPDKIDYIDAPDLDRDVLEAKDRHNKINGMVSKVQGMIWTTEKLIKQNDKSGICASCGQEIDEEKVASVLKDLRTRLSKLCAKEERLLIALSDADSALKIAMQKKEDVARHNTKYQEYVRSIERSKREIERLEASIVAIGGRENVYKAQLKDAVRKQSQIKSKLVDLENDKSALESDVPYYQFWLKAFGDKGIKSFVFDSICGKLTTKANRFVNILTNSDMSISFDTQSKLKSGELREKFECCITKDGRNIPYHQYSGGEKRRISLAVDMALSEIMAEFYGTKFNFLVLDEQSNYIDIDGKAEYFKLAKELAKDKCVIVIDHDSMLKSKFDRVINVVKRGGFSKID